jgi:hypothetical protein
MEYDIRIEYRCGANLRTDSDSYCQKITGTIIATALNSEDEDGQTIGEIELAYMDVISAQNDGTGLFNLFDADSRPSTYCFTLYDLEQHDWSKLVYQNLGEDIIDSNLLIIHRIKLLPEFRGLQIGRLAIRRSIQQFGHDCGLACLKAYPYQIELHKQYSTDPNEYEAYGLGHFTNNSPERLLLLNFG